MNKQIVIAAGIAAAFSVIGGVIFVGSVFMAKEGANVSLTETEDNKVKVVASFFPVYDFARKVWGDRVKVWSMIPMGIEPHDLEPIPLNLIVTREAVCSMALDLREGG